MIKKIDIYIDSTISEGRACYVFPFQYRKISEFFRDSDIYRLTNNKQKADYIIILSCVISGQFYDKSVKDINHDI